MDLDLKFKEKVLKTHEKLGGKVKISPLKNFNRDLLKLIYTPGVALACKEIVSDKSTLYKYTIKQNTIAIISNGTAVLGLGDIGPEGALPVIEGKVILLKQISGVNAYPICI